MNVSIMMRQVKMSSGKIINLLTMIIIFCVLDVSNNDDGGGTAAAKLTLSSIRYP